MAVNKLNMSWTLLAFFILGFGITSRASLTQSRLQNRDLQRVINHKRINIVLEGVRARALNTIKPDPILLVNFLEIDHQFKVSITVWYGSELHQCCDCCFRSTSLKSRQRSRSRLITRMESGARTSSCPSLNCLAMILPTIML